MHDILLYGNLILMLVILGWLLKKCWKMASDADFVEETLEKAARQGKIEWMEYQPTMTKNWREKPMPPHYSEDDA